MTEIASDAPTADAPQPGPAPDRLASTRHRVADGPQGQEYFHSRGWTDGLPVVPPTAVAVQACLDWAGLPPDHLIGVEPVRQRAITAEKVADADGLICVISPRFVESDYTKREVEAFVGRDEPSDAEPEAGKPLFKDMLAEPQPA